MTENCNPYIPNPDPHQLLVHMNNMLDDECYSPNAEDFFEIGVDSFAYGKGINDWQKDKSTVGREISLNFSSKDLGGTIYLTYREDMHGEQGCYMQLVHNEGPIVPTLTASRYAGKGNCEYWAGFDSDAFDDTEGILPIYESRNMIRHLRDAVAQHMLSR